MLANLNIAVGRVWKCQSFADPKWFPVVVKGQVRIHHFPTEISVQIWNNTPYTHITAAARFIWHTAQLFDILCLHCRSFILTWLNKTFVLFCIFFFVAYCLCYLQLCKNKQKLAILGRKCLLIPSCISTTWLWLKLVICHLYLFVVILNEQVVQ